MPIYLQTVMIPERCFLYEALYWLAFQRLPVASFDPEGVEMHESRELLEEGRDEYGEYITDDECKRAGIPPDPDYQAMVAGEYFSSSSHYDRVLGISNLEDAGRERLLKEKQLATEHEARREEWKGHFERAVEYSASLIFVSLKGGSLVAMGRLIRPNGGAQTGIEDDDEEEDVFSIEPTGIPARFWTLKGIDFDESAASNGADTYKFITLLTADVLALFPGDRQPVDGIERVGDAFVLSDPINIKPKSVGRGRPPYPWEDFHVEVARLLREKLLPEKKEAAIQLLQTWFQEQFNLHPSRAAVGAKLTLYYEKFVRQPDRKS